MGGAMKKLSAELALARSKNQWYGVVHGFPLTLSETSSVLTVAVGADFLTPESKAEFVARLHQNRRQHKIIEVKANEAGFHFGFAPLGAYKRVIAFLDWLWPALSEAGVRGDLCPLCGLEVSGGTWARVDGVVCLAHGACLTRAEQEAEERGREMRMQPKRRLRGLAGAVLGAAAGTLPWMLAYHMGWFVAILGALIAWTAQKGYELLGGRPSHFKLWAVMLSVVCAVLFSFVALEGIYAVTQEGMAVSDLPLLFIFYATLPGFWSYYAVDIGLGLLFAGLGCYGMVGELRRETGGGGRIEYLAGDRPGAMS